MIKLLKSLGIIVLLFVVNGCGSSGGSDTDKKDVATSTKSTSADSSDENTTKVTKTTESIIVDDIDKADITSNSTSQSNPDTNKTTTVTLTPCESNIIATLDKSAVDVMQNNTDTTTHIVNNMYAMLDNMNEMLEDMDTMNQRVLETTELSAKTFATIADSFNISSDGSKLFEVKDGKFSIKTPLSKDYILASSANRFFPDSQTLKTLFNDSASLAKAYTRAIETANKSNNLYMTILQVESNGTITNLTNGLLIPKSSL